MSALKIQHRLGFSPQICKSGGLERQIWPTCPQTFKCHHPLVLIILVYHISKLPKKEHGNITVHNKNSGYANEITCM